MKSKLDLSFILVAAFLGLTDSLFADFQKSGLFAADPTAFLRTSPPERNDSSFKVEPWFAIGVTNGDRSPEFVLRLKDASAKGNAIVQGFLGTLLVKGDGVPTDTNEGMRLL